MSFNLLVIVFTCLVAVSALSSFDRALYTLPLTGNYMAIRNSINRSLREPSRQNMAGFHCEINKRQRYGARVLEHMFKESDRRDQLFRVHTELVNESEDMNRLNILVTAFINEMLVQYTLYFFELVPSLYLLRELGHSLPPFLEAVQEKLLELFKISTLSILDASPRSKIRLLMTSIQFRIIVEKLEQVCKMVNVDFKFDDMESVIATVNDERLSKIALWSVVHSQALKKGLVMLSRAFLIATLNNMLVPFMFKSLSQVIPSDIPGYSLIQWLLKSFNLSFL